MDGPCGRAAVTRDEDTLPMGSANPARHDPLEPAAPLARACRDAVLELTGTGTVSREAVARVVALALGLAPAVSEGRPYGRRELYSHHAEGEVMLARWRPGASSAPHDHGGARGFVTVVEGTFEERVYPRVGRGLGLDPVQDARTWAPGDGVAVAERVVHTMTCLDGGLTLHVYAGPPGPFRVYDVAGGVTYLASGGAWLPPDTTLAVYPWGAP